MTRSQNRRRFLQTTAAAGAVGLLSTGSVLGANERL
ncbi:MAG: hypothetical protein ACI9HK_002016, partial [Pirellulaceae bacterium]